MTSSDDYKALESKYYMQVVNRMPPVLVRGEGTRVFDNDDKSYLDFTAGWAVLNIGHNHPAVTEAIRDQAGKILQMSNLFYTTPQLPLAEIIVENSDVDRVFFCNSGAEANEGACKVARKWGKTKLDGAYEIITTFDSFHGRTQAMMAATGQPAYQEKWTPLMPGFVNVPYNDVQAIKDAYVEGRTCAVMIEPVQGEGGVNIPSENYLKDVMDFCHEKNILFMLDEVQTGMGRIGTLFGYQQFPGVEPDVMTLAKALGSGAPLGAFTTKEFCSVLEPGDHGSTFGGNALTTAAGAAAAKVIVDENIPELANETGAYFQGKLNSLAEKYEFITEVRGMGLLIALQMNVDIAGAAVTAALPEGLLINAVRPNMIRFMPPLNVTRDEIDEAVAILDKVLGEVS
ncbi:aspartate aminotransferase family protein [Candidatus Lucifugimonas marina]|uniref:Acetylornithine aminotransferase n=1 Tax=Candidatus Lucifugimonas marina TaxID=3038979 RepID=A0AAJ6CSG1_9CHLR|nr:acetylornithine/succinylornithine family transaminase [SAR202 cluster bacterium JH702]MDG0869610.1 acetylornithine/succinylornithine family transaminase [SAR202 cluster bacterium JH639]WFG34343.1 acetylornithine/succinylornithine family transaminase [SAR202 cluster bacterium JH545]WFG38272.1 acetylornithine/succinylornithine family transaminase [SAR202 cluster bacterium JH1073]